jgi:hypothetical protein
MNLPAELIDINAGHCAIPNFGFTLHRFGASCLYASCLYIPLSDCGAPDPSRQRLPTDIRETRRSMKD